MWEYPDSFGYQMLSGTPAGWTPQNQPWLYRPYDEENHPWFDHHMRGQNRTMIFNGAGTGESGIY
jgi:hypothetical protein